MCLSPIKLPNPYFGKSKLGLKSHLDFLHDTESQYITVGCGKCVECISLKQNYIAQRAYVESLVNDAFFFTLTYNCQSLPEVVDELGEVHSYPAYDDIHLCIKRMRKHGDLPSGTKYIVCSEYGSHTHRPHFHGIFFVPRPEKFDNKVYERDVPYTNYIDKLNHKLFRSLRRNWSRNVGTRKNPVYVPNTTYVRSRKGYNFDLHYVKSVAGKSLSSVVTYVLKYMTKYDKWYTSKDISLQNELSKDNYLYIKSLIRPRIFISKNFGFIDCSSRPSCIDDALSYYKQHPDDCSFKILIDNRFYRLCPYLVNKYAYESELIDLWYSQPDPVSLKSNVQINSDILYEKWLNIPKFGERVEHSKYVLQCLRLKSFNQDTYELE